MNSKYDGMQITIAILFIINSFMFIYTAYRIDLNNDELIRGYENFFNWVILAYTFYVTAHVFGYEVMSLNPHAIAIGVIYIASVWMKYFIGAEGVEKLYGSLILCTLSLASLLGMLYLDRARYYTGRRTNK